MNEQQFYKHQYEFYAQLFLDMISDDIIHNRMKELQEERKKKVDEWNKTRYGSDGENCAPIYPFGKVGF